MCRAVSAGLKLHVADSIGYMSGWRDLNPRPLDPQTESRDFDDLAIRRDLASDLGF